MISSDPARNPAAGAADPPPREKSDELRPEEAAEPVVAPAASAGSAVRKSATITLLPARLRPPDDLNAVAIAGAMQAADPPYLGGRDRKSLLPSRRFSSLRMPPGCSPARAGSAISSTSQNDRFSRHFSGDRAEDSSGPRCPRDPICARASRTGRARLDCGERAHPLSGVCRPTMQRVKSARCCVRPRAGGTAETRPNPKRAAETFLIRRAQGYTQPLIAHCPGSCEFSR